MGGLPRYARVRLLSTLAILAFGAVSATAAAAAIATAAAPATATAAGPSGGRGHDTVRGIAARTINLVEKGSLRLASAPGTTIKEKGSATGTFKGTLFAIFTTTSASRGTFKMTSYFSGGTLSFSGVSRDHVVGATGYAEGTVRVSGGTGRFAHASGSGMRFRVIVNRRNFYATAELRGRLSL